MSPVPPPLLLLVVTTLLGPLSLHIVIPCLPVIGAAFARDAATVQLVLTVFIVVIAVAQLVYGPLSDRFGRRPLMLAGLAIYIAGSALCATAETMPLLIAGRALQACGSCAGLVLSRAIIRDVYDRNRSAGALATLTMAMTLGSSTAPLVGAYGAMELGWRANFIGLLGLGIVVLAYAVLRLNETNSRATPISVMRMGQSYAMLLRSRRFLGYALNTSFSVASWYGFIAAAPYVLAEAMGEPPTTFGIMILMVMAGYFAGNFVTSRLSQRLGTDPLMVAGVLISLAAMALMAVWAWRLPATPLALFVPMTLSVFGNGLSQPSATAGSLAVAPEIAGAASGLLGFLQMMVGAAGTFVVGYLPHETSGPTIAMVATGIALSLVAALAALRGRPGSR